MKLFNLLIFIFSSHWIFAQDVIYTKQGGMIKHITITKDNGDTLTYYITKSKLAQFILKSEVQDYIISSNKDVLTPEYRAKAYEIQQSTVPSYPKNADTLDLINHMDNALMYYGASILSMPISTAIATLIVVSAIPPAVPIIIVSTGLVLTVVYTVKFIKELRYLGKDIVALKRKVNRIK